MRDVDSDRARSAARGAGRRSETAAARRAVRRVQASGLRCLAVRATHRLGNGAAAALRAVPNAPRAVHIQQSQILRRSTAGRNQRGQPASHQVLLSQHQGPLALLEPQRTREHRKHRVFVPKRPRSHRRREHREGTHPMRRQREENRRDHKLHGAESPSKEPLAAEPTHQSGMRQCQHLPGTRNGLHCALVRTIQSDANHRVFERSEAIERRFNASKVWVNHCRGCVGFEV